MLIEGEREEVWRDCSKQCGYAEKLIMRPAVVITREVMEPKEILL